MVMNNLSAPDMGVVMAVISSCHLFWTLSLQALQLEVNQAVPYRDLGVLIAPCLVGDGAACGGLL